jgi:integrase
MAGRPQDIRILELQYRSPNARSKSPHVVRWKIDGRPFAKAHRTKAPANKMRAELISAHGRGEWFDPDRRGLPLSWLPAVDDMRLFEWARRWVAEQWPEWAPRTRRSAIEALCRFLQLAREPDAPEPPDGLRLYLKQALIPESEPEDPNDCAAWLSRWSLMLSALNRDVLSDVEVKLGLGDKDQALAASTAGRYRKVSKACVSRAVEILSVLDADPWPPPPKGRNRRKANRRKRTIDVKSLPGPKTMAKAIKAMKSHQPGSRKYQVMTATSYYGGLRPSEVVMLRPRALDLPEDGFGLIRVTEADIDWDEPGEPKEGERDVPIPPVLVAILREWIKEIGATGDDLLFRTRNDNRPTLGNWGRSLKRAMRLAGHKPIRVYDLRHAAATTWIQAGVPLKEASRRLGNSVEILVSTYVGAFEGDEELANDRIELALAA